MATILNSAILDSAMLHKTLTQSYSIWLKVIHSDSTWWWQPSWTLPSCIQPFAQKNFTHAFSLKLMIAAILNSAILDSAILHKKKLHLFILTQLDDGSHLEICHVGFRHCHLGFKHLVIFSQIHSKTLSLHSDLTQTNSIWLNWDDGNHLEFCHLGFSHVAQNSDSILFNLTQSHSFWLNLMMAAILNSAILYSAICTKNFTHAFSLKLMIAAILNSAILDSAILHKKNFTCSFWLNLMMAAILKSAMLDSDTAILDSNTLSSSLRFTQKHSSSTLILTQTNSIWLT